MGLVSTGDLALDSDCLRSTVNALGIHVVAIVRNLFWVEMAYMVGLEVPDTPLNVAFCGLLAGVAGNECGYLFE